MISESETLCVGTPKQSEWDLTNEETSRRGLLAFRHRRHIYVEKTQRSMRRVWVVTGHASVVRRSLTTYSQVYCIHETDGKRRDW